MTGLIVASIEIPAIIFGSMALHRLLFGRARCSKPWRRKTCHGYHPLAEHRLCRKR